MLSLLTKGYIEEALLYRLLKDRLESLTFRGVSIKKRFFYLISDIKYGNSLSKLTP